MFFNHVNQGKFSPQHPSVSAPRKYTASFASLWLMVMCWTALFGITTPVAASTNADIDGRKASAAVNFTIIIPAVLRILDNEHPITLMAAQPTANAPTERLGAVQKITVVSTLRQGFCMDLRLSRGDIADWKMNLQSVANVWLESTADGYRMCTGRPGRHLLTLEHAFTWQPADNRRVGAFNEMAWPVNVSLSAP